MSSLFLPYRLSHDLETQTWCAEGCDLEDKVFGVGAGKTEQEAKNALKLYILESLLADERNRIHGLSETEPSAGNIVCFTPKDLFPIRLRHARLRAGLTQKDVARQLSMSQQAYRKFEMIDANPTLKTVDHLEYVLKVSLLS